VRETRDPRIDPIPGDVLHKHGKMWITKRRVEQLFMGLTEKVLVSDRGMIPEWISIDGFRRWAKGAEVVRRGK
jgi:hypothetical protein